MPRARVRESSHVEYVELERDLTASKGDFLVINDIGQFIFNPEQFAERFEVEQINLPASARHTPNVSGIKKRRGITSRAAQELNETINLLYAEQCERFSPEQLADPNYPKGITARQILDSGLLAEHLAENINLSATITHWAYVLIERKLVVRDKFYVNTEIGKREVWHYRPT